MKALIFAGGKGTRLWPLSRSKSPKQFEKVIGDKSTLQLAVERILPDFGYDDIFIATGSDYKKSVAKQLPDLPNENIIGEPATRDVGPAVGYALSYLKRKFKNDILVILWCDHLVKKEDVFKKIIRTSREVINSSKEQIIFISQKPRFASQNLGWIRYSGVKRVKNGINFHEFAGFEYRPDIKRASEYLKSKNTAWNIGYFVTTIDFLWNEFRLRDREIFDFMKDLYNAGDEKDFNSILLARYPKLPKISFDNLILDKLKSENALVVCEDLGWSDIGAWEALKEALQESPEDNIIKGKVLLKDVRDTLVYNYTDKLVVVIDLSGHIVINTKDVILVGHKNSVPKIKKLVEELASSENSHLT